MYIIARATAEFLRLDPGNGKLLMILRSKYFTIL